MALREVPMTVGRMTLRELRPWAKSLSNNGLRQVSTEASGDLQDLESSSFSSSGPSEDVINAWDPAKRAKARKRELPRSR